MNEINIFASLISGRISGAHINPAGTFALALAGEFRWALVPIYMVAQYLGGFLAALLLYVNYAEGINELDGGVRSTYGDPLRSSGGIFATYPGQFISIWGSLLDQTLGTFIFFYALSAITDTKNSGLEKRFQPIAISFAVCGICMAFLPNCGAIFNPARDVAPRLLTALVGYADPSPWAPVGGLYWLTAGLIGPHLGAILGVFGYKYTIKIWLRSPTREYDLEYIDNSDIDTNNNNGNGNQQQQQQQRQITKNFPESISYGSTVMHGGQR